MPDPITLVPAKRKAREGVKAALLEAAELADQEGAAAVAIVFVTGDGSAVTITNKGENVFTLIGAVQQLNFKLMER